MAGMLHRWTTGLWARARGLHRAILADMRRAHQERMDQAHIATRGDRPFMGCGPGAAGADGAPAGPRLNPAAVRRDA